MKKITSLQKCVFGVRKKENVSKKLQKKKRRKEKKKKKIEKREEIKRRKWGKNNEKLQLRQNILECGIKVSSAMFA